MERFSMKEFTPLTWEEKKMRLEVKRRGLEKQREPLVDQKKELELELSELNSQVEGKHLEQVVFDEICKRQQEIKREKWALEKSILDIKRELQDVNQEIERTRLKIKSAPNDAIQSSLIDLRDKYMAFAADTTRVSSMRAMSSRFVEEVQAILKILNQQ